MSAEMRSQAAQLALVIPPDAEEEDILCRGVLSANYLRQHFAWSEDFPKADELRQAYEELKRLWQAEYVGLCKRGEAYTCTQFLEPVLRRLGWQFIPKQDLPPRAHTRKRPDYCLFLDDQARRRAAGQAATVDLFRESATVLEAKKVQHSLDEVSSTETPGGFPSQQVQDYLHQAKDATGRRFFNWAILTNGNEWIGLLACFAWLIVGRSSVSAGFRDCTGTRATPCVGCGRMRRGTGRLRSPRRATLLGWVAAVWLGMTFSLRVQAADPAAALAAYRAELDRFRADYGGTRELPEMRFFLFGMGHRPKFIYREGRLLDARTGAEVRQWRLGTETIVPPDYLVALQTADGAQARIFEDEIAVWIETDGRREALSGTRVPVKLPTFSGHPYARVLRVLHQELLVNITPAGPVPNFFVYAKPWYRDGAMMALAFKETGNLDLIRGWVLGLGQPFDRNNGGETEADNLGQVLFLVSLVSDTNHPVVARVLAELPRFEQTGPQGRFIRGRTDFAEHPVYQTKWLKFGLRALGLPEAYAVPAVPDSYGALFWMDYRDQHTPGRDADDRADYPYLGWASDHFHRTKKSPVSNRDYPLTWERHASQANYRALRVLDPIYADQKLAAPHTWHAAEVFLYVLKEGQSGAVLPKAYSPLRVSGSQRRIAYPTGTRQSGRGSG